MSKAIVGVGIAAIVVAGAAVGLQQQDNRALRREVASLREEMQRARGAERMRAPDAEAGAGGAASLPAAGQAQGGVAGGEELAKLREEIAALRKSTTALNKFAEMAQASQAAKALEKAGESVVAKLVPATQWRNAGKGTPEASTETVMWAALGGDVDTLANAVTFTETSRVKADAWFATLSEATRRQYGSAEKVLALMIARDAAALTGMQVLGKKELTADDVAVRLRFAADDKTKDETFLMRRGADGYRLVLPDQTVESLAKKVSGKK